MGKINVSLVAVETSYNVEIEGGKSFTLVEDYDANSDSIIHKMYDENNNELEISDFVMQALVEFQDKEK